MNGLRKLLRRKGYGVKQIEEMLLRLRPVSVGGVYVDEDSGTLEDAVRRLKQAPELSMIAQGRVSLEEAGYRPKTEGEHTVKIPLKPHEESDTDFFCVTRLTDVKWACYRDGK